MFLVNVPVVVVALVLGQLFVPTSRDPGAPPVDFLGAVLSIVGLVALVWAIIEGAHGWTDPLVLGAFAVAAVLLAAFIVWERRTRTPMLDMSFFRNPRFSAASGALMLTFFAMMGSLFLLTQFLQSVLGYTRPAGRRPAAADGRRADGGRAPVGQDRRAVRQQDRRHGRPAARRRRPAARQPARAPIASYGQVVVALIVLAVGLALVMPPATESIMGSLPPAKAGVGSAVNDTTREVGAALGVAVLGSIMSSTYRPRVSDAIAGQPVPAEAATAIKDQVGAALEIAQRIGGAPGRALAEVASNGFADGMGRAFLVGAAALLVGAIVTALYLPARQHDHEGGDGVPGPGGEPLAVAPVGGPVDGDGADDGVTAGNGARRRR